MSENRIMVSGAQVKSSIDIKPFLQDCKTRGLTDHTIATYKSNIEVYLRFVGDPVKVDIPKLCEFLNYLRVMEYKRGRTVLKGVSSKTIKAYFSAISTYYEYLVFIQAVEVSLIPTFTKRYLSRMKDQYNGENSRQLISIEQMKQLINQDMPIQDKAVLMVLAKTGIRRGELISIDIADINLKDLEIILKPKAKRTNRRVIFDEETAKLLQLFLAWRKSKAKCKSLFISPWGSRMNRDEPNKIIARQGVKIGLHDPKANLNKKLTPHAFRHWFTTHLRRAGMSREMIQELRGDRRKEAIDIYDHIDLSELKDRYFKCMPGLIDIYNRIGMSDLKDRYFECMPELLETRT